MKPGDLQLKTTTSRLKYFALSVRETKCHPGGVSNNEDERQFWNDGMVGKSPLSYSMPREVLGKTDIHDALPKNHNASSFCSAGEVWFCNLPIWKHKLENFL